MVLDFATTRIAGGKVALAAAKGVEVPPGCIIDKDGNPDHGSECMAQGRGALLPFGEHKGFGIMVALEILSRILAGLRELRRNRARRPAHANRRLDDGSHRQRRVFVERRIATRTSDLVQRIQAVPPAVGVEASHGAWRFRTSRAHTPFERGHSNPRIDLEGCSERSRRARCEGLASPNGDARQRTVQRSGPKTDLLRRAPKKRVTAALLTQGRGREAHGPHGLRLGTWNTET